MEIINFQNVLSETILWATQVGEMLFVVITNYTNLIGS